MLIPTLRAAELCRVVLHRTLPKPQGVRTGNWEAVPLSAQQEEYAARDAYAGLLVYQCLQVGVGVCLWLCF